jgi:Zn-finger nucleic acid-binding protein
MNRVRHPDITTDKCPSCEGVFLEKGELDVMATGMAGSIEYCSIEESKIRTDKFPMRICPKCSDQKMEKINLLAFSDLIFDFCPKCESFFLDKGEIKLMNDYLRDLAPEDKAQEYRGYRNNYLVRIDRRRNVKVVGHGFAGLGTHATGFVDICISVYFQQPLKTDLRVFQEKWYAQLTKALGLLKVQDIPTGDKEFDKRFRVQGENERTVITCIPRDFRKAMLDFVSKEPKIHTRIGSLQLSSNMISYTEGPYAMNAIPDLLTKAEPIVQELLHLTNLIAPRQ